MDTTTEITSSERDEAAFRESVIKLRKEKGWSQNRLAKELQDAGLTEYRQATVARLENGERTLKLGESRVIAEIFETSVEEMISQPGLADSAKAFRDMRSLQNEANNNLISGVGRYLATRDLALRKIVDSALPSDAALDASVNRVLVKSYLESLEALKTVTRTSLMELVSAGIEIYLEIAHKGCLDLALEEIENTDLKKLVAEIKNSEHYLKLLPESGRES
ncbi:helix-turn-helix transcriptional regulator [Rothia sp. L_38]|uniref:helix-turn-helix transcriptional regulator n=1 Tax=Rothia sp. L_38 TaxID=3422315 RepID=UPI003D6BE471